MPTENYVLKLAVGGFIPPVGRRSAFTTSRLAVLEDGSTMPVLLMLAERKFKRWSMDEYFPFWIDGDSTNETFRNVDLASRANRPGKPRRQMTTLGVPSGTKEYMKRWHAKNKEKVAITQRNYHARRRLIVLQAASELEGLPDIFGKLQAAITPTEGDGPTE